MAFVRNDSRSKDAQFLNLWLSFDYCVGNVRSGHLWCQFPCGYSIFFMNYVVIPSSFFITDIKVHFAWLYIRLWSAVVVPQMLAPNNWKEKWKLKERNEERGWALRSSLGLKSEMVKRTIFFPRNLILLNLFMVRTP